MGSTTHSGPMTSDNGFIGEMVGTAAATTGAEAGAGITDGTGTVLSTSKSKSGKVITTQIFVDVTGLGSSTDDLDIIGSGASAAYLTQIDFATMGQLFAATMTCLEAPVTGVTSIDLYSAVEDTGVFDAGIGSLDETICITAGAAWTLNKTQTATPATDIPVDDSFLYLTGGAAGTADTYSAGQFLIELYGYAA
jgi:hypothetical protein